MGKTKPAADNIVIELRTRPADLKFFMVYVRPEEGGGRPNFIGNIEYCNGSREWVVTETAQQRTGDEPYSEPDLEGAIEEIVKDNERSKY